MVQLYCTQKLGKLVQARNGEGFPQTGHDWSGHLFFIFGRKCIIFVHKKTLYTVMLLDIVKKDMAHINRLFLDSFVGQLEADKILGNHEALIRDIYNEITLVSTDNDRKTLGTINNIVSIFQGATASGHFADLVSAKRYAFDGINKMPWKPLGYGNSRDMMRQMLNKIDG